MTKFLDNIESHITNKRIPPKFPILSVTDEIREIPYSIGYEYKLSVELGCYIAAKDSTELTLKQKSIRRMIAHEVYGDVLQSFDNLCLALYERGMLDRELGEMVTNITDMMRGVEK